MMLLSGTGLSSVYLPSKLSYIGDGIFADCENLATIDVDENNPNYISIDGVVYSKDKKRIVEFPAGKNLESYIIDDNVEYISNKAFEYCKNLKSITLGNNVKSIGYYSFDYCTNLVNINIPLNLEEIGYATFSGCTKLSYVYLSSSIKKMESIVFNSCTNLTIDCEFEETEIPNTWESDWYGSAKIINYGVKRED